MPRRLLTVLIERKNRLGRGLEALIPKTIFGNERIILELDVNEIEANPYQPRIEFSESQLFSLSESIKAHGVNQPIIVRRKEDGQYELIAGERRLRASQLAGKKTIPAIIKNFSDKESLQFALIENLEREDLKSIEIAKGYKRLLDEFSLTHQDIAEIFSKSRSTVSNALRLLELPNYIQEALLKGDVSEGQVRPLIPHLSAPFFKILWKTILEKKISARQVETQVRALLKSPKIPPELDRYSKLEQYLSEHLLIKVKIKKSKKGGNLTLFFKSENDYIRLVEKLSAPHVSHETSV